MRATAQKRSKSKASLSLPNGAHLEKVLIRPPQSHQQLGPSHLQCLPRKNEAVHRIGDDEVLHNLGCSTDSCNGT